MMNVACHEPATSPATEPVVASSALRRPGITPVFDTRINRSERRRRGATQSIAVPVYSRIVYRAGTVSVR